MGEIFLVLNLTTKTTKCNRHEVYPLAIYGIQSNCIIRICDRLWEKGPFRAHHCERSLPQLRNDILLTWIASSKPELLPHEDGSPGYIDFEKQASKSIAIILPCFSTYVRIFAHTQYVHGNTSAKNSLAS